MKVYDFKRDLEQNEKYEYLFADWLKSIGRKEIEVSQGYFPDYDVKADGVTYEIKRDYVCQTSKNLLVELYFNKEENRFGWIKYSKADYLVVFVTDTIFYMVQMSELRFKFDYAEIWTRKDITQSEGFTTVNYVAPLHNFRVKWYNAKS